MLERLQAIPIFTGLDVGALDLLWQRGVQSKAKPGDVIVREGDVGNRFYLILSGSVRVSKGLGTPEQVELAVLKQGDFFGEMCILETLPRAATVVAVGKTSLFCLSSLTFLHLYDTMPKQYGLLLLNMARDLSRRIRRLDERFAARH